MDNNMNLSEKLEKAEKVAKANAKAKAEAEDVEKAQQKAKLDELMSRIEPAANALKRFLEGSEGQAIIKFLREFDFSIYLSWHEPIGLARLAFWRKDPREHYYLSGKGLWVTLRYDRSTTDSDGYDTWKEIEKTRRATWDDYVNMCRSRALQGVDPFCVIETIKAEASKLADSLLGSNTK